MAEMALTKGEHVLTTAEAAKLMRITPRSLRAWAAAKRVPGARIGREYRFSERALLKLLEQTAGDERAPAAGGR